MPSSIRKRVGPGFGAFIALLFFPAVLQAASTLNFPKLPFESNSYTGIAIVNPTSQDAVVTLTAYATGGTPLTGGGFVNPAQITIKANQQIAKLTTELFGAGLAATTVGWFQATSPADGLTGFFLFLDGAVTFLDGADLPPTAQRLAFHQIRLGSGFATEIDLVNPGSSEANVQIELVSAGSPRVAKFLTLPKKGMTRIDAATFFGVTDVSAAAYVSVQSDVEVAGIEFVKNAQGELLGLNGRNAAEQLDRLAFPQLAVLGGYTTELGLLNYSTAPVILTISAFNPAGELYGTANLKNNPVTRTLAGGASLREDLETMFGFAGSTTVTGWVEVKATAQAVNGYLTYGIPASGAAAAVITAPVGRTRALFSHIATAGYFTGVAALNPGSLAANIRIVALKPTGEVLGSYDGVLQPGERIAKLVGTSELIPEAANLNGGLIWVKSNLPVFLASVFGSTTVLANVPPQEAPDTYNPDSAIPALRMTPPLAILQPNQTQTFQLQGAASSPQWKVNGTVGGQSGTGTISATGVFTAPSAVPSKQVATITGESSSQAAGASVDVIEKGTLLGNLAVVQSVAYVAGLSKLYAAEFTALSGFNGFQSDPPAVDNGNSQVVDVSANGSKTLVLTFNGENVAKLLPFRAADGRDYLLASGQLGGRIIRVDPTTRQFVNVVSGLKEPSAMVFDAATGDLLVAEKDKITTIARATIETGISPAAPYVAGDERGGRIGAVPPPISLSGVAGLAINRCNGHIYATLPADGSLIEYNPATGRIRTLLTGLNKPGALRVIYRSGGSCPAVFNLLLSERGLDRAILVTSADGDFVPWLRVQAASDFLLLPPTNPFAPRQGVLIGENAGTTGSVALVRVSSLYDDEPANPPLPETTAPGKADVALIATAQPDPASVGATLTYTITVQNKGPATATNVTVVVRGAAELSPLSITSTVGTCAFRTGIGECLVGSLALNRQAVITLRTTVSRSPGDGFIGTSVSVTATEIDPDVNNNSTFVRTPVGTGTRASTLRISGLPSSVTAGVPAIFTVTARDTAGAIVTDYTGTVRFTSTDPIAVLPANYTFTATDGGSHSFSATLRTVGDQRLTAVDTLNSSLADNQGVTVLLSATDHFSVSVPSSIVPGTPFSATVTARTASGAVSITYRGTIRFTSSDTTATLPANYTFTAADAGVHTFASGVTLRTLGSQTVRATDTATASITGTQTVQVSSTGGTGNANSYTIALPATVVSGAATTVTISAVDFSGKVVTNYTGTIRFTSSDAQAILPASYTFTASDAGVHTFDKGITLKALGLQSITVSDTQVAFLAGKQEVTVTAAAAAPR